MNYRSVLCIVLACYTCLTLITFTALAQAEVERFPARDGDAIELWRITNDPLVRDHANYHNTQCWSPDGRYLAYVHCAADDRQYGAQAASEIHLFDTHNQKDVFVDRGENPRWANKHNWLLYARFHPQDGPKSGKGTQVIWLDVGTGRKTRIAYGVSYFKETDCDDRWLYGQRIPDGGRREAVRIPIQEDSQVEVLPGDGVWDTIPCTSIRLIQRSFCQTGCLGFKRPTCGAFTMKS